jgi:hypothetical protein
LIELSAIAVITTFWFAVLAFAVDDVLILAGWVRRWWWAR